MRKGMEAAKELEPRGYGRIWNGIRCKYSHAFIVQILQRSGGWAWHIVVAAKCGSGFSNLSRSSSGLVRASKINLRRVIIFAPTININKGTVKVHSLSRCSFCDSKNLKKTHDDGTPRIAQRIPWNRYRLYQLHLETGQPIRLARCFVETSKSPQVCTKNTKQGSSYFGKLYLLEL